MKHFQFVVVVYNNIVDTLSFFDSLSNQIPGDYEFSVVLVDNSDDPQVMLKIDEATKAFKFVKVLRPKENIGYFPAVSFALPSLNKNNDYAIVCNNDLVFYKNFCLNLLKANYDNEVMVVCPDVITFNGLHQNPHHKHRLRYYEVFYFDLLYSNYIFAIFFQRISKLTSFVMRLFRHSTLIVRGSRTPQFIDQGIGSIYILRPSFLAAIDCKLFYPGFLYCEEACISWQVRYSNGKIFYDPSLKVLHSNGATLNQKSNYWRYSYARESYWKIRDRL